MNRVAKSLVIGPSLLAVLSVPLPAYSGGKTKKFTLLNMKGSCPAVPTRIQKIDVTINKTDNLSRLSLLPTLTELTALASSIGDAENFVSLPELINLDLTWADVTNKGVARIAQLCPELRALTLAYCLEVGDKGIIELIDQNPNLIYLDLSGTRITTNSLLAIAIFCKDLRVLNLEECKGITKKSLAYLATLPKLKAVSIPKKGWLGKEEAKTYLNELAHEYLNISEANLEDGPGPWTWINPFIRTLPDKILVRVYRRLMDCLDSPITFKSKLLWPYNNIAHRGEYLGTNTDMDEEWF